MFVVDSSFHKNRKEELQSQRAGMGVIQLEPSPGFPLHHEEENIIS